ncbi:protein rep [Enterococcus hirae]|uniref:protein rep n=1 Tax=Enterococcus hirae TaxID=1354 RepID=UPI003D80E37C
MNQKQWIQFWKKAMKLDYDPNVKVQMIRPKNKYKSDIQSAIDETAKYPVKDTDFMTDDEEKNFPTFLFWCLSDRLKQQISYFRLYLGFFIQVIR